MCPCSNKRGGEVCSLVTTPGAKNNKEKKGFIEENQHIPDSCLLLVPRSADVQRARRPAPEVRDPGGERAGPVLHPAECGEGHEKGQNVTPQP